MTHYEECAHCGGSVTIRNPKGYCDHLYYPDNCAVCTEERRQKYPTQYEKLESWARKAAKWIESVRTVQDYPCSWETVMDEAKALGLLGAEKETL